ncbi:caspase family protein [Candidatus Halocynthiibacter alkanivorans]|uniref:caspase family protein n=1 Tax=Candidatus Halocynthiibacter alkanivorans TaxID=2267619 RepID=UPI0013583D8B|nr:caspase family protein [Candidatus Halocynthiibacter alkanivorans]
MVVGSALKLSEGICQEYIVLGFPEFTASRLTGTLRLLLLSCLLLLPLSAQAQQRVALLVGNANYLDPTLSLRNPANDARALGDRLETLGFQVTRAIDMDQAEMSAQIARFQTEAAGAEIALYFYAGHGVQIGGENYMIATDFQVSDAANLAAASVPMGAVRDAFAAARPDLGVLILDACRNNPFVDAGVVERGLVRTKGVTGMLIAYATDPGNVAYDGIGENSVFTNALLDHISTPGLDARLMMGRVRQQVVLETFGEQVPWVEESVLGEYSIAPADPGAPQQSDAVAAEIALWSEVSTRAQVQGFETYLKRYPSGLFAAFAEDRIALLTRVDTDETDLSTTTGTLLASADPGQVSAALSALGLLPLQRGLTRANNRELTAAFRNYRQQTPDPTSATPGQLYDDAARVSMVFAASTAQRIRTDMVALKSVQTTLVIAEDATAQIRNIALSNADALPVLADAERDLNAIRDARQVILQRLDQSRDYYELILNRAIRFVPDTASVSLLGSSERQRGLGQLDQQVFQDAEQFLEHVKNADEARKGSYSWLTDLLPD